ncbi:MAG: radical SAM protein [Myxococcales bacterium]|nr:radical SAM protein [Myxococcales bacterium]
MGTATFMQGGFVFGPLASRRLGRSLGINNVPRKTCSYSCVYCQAGRTPHTEIERRAFYEPAALVAEVTARVEKVRQLGEPLDYLTFVPQGEPTLDIELGRTIELLRPLRIPIAVISNGSLLWQPEVRRALAAADWVSLKVDTVHEDIWHRHNRPAEGLSLDRVLAGMKRFAADARGALVSETMLVRGSNDTDVALEATADFIATLSPTRSYVTLPLRPTSEAWAQPAEREAVDRARWIFWRRIGRVVVLDQLADVRPTCHTDVVSLLRTITAVHPLHHDEVELLLARSGMRHPLLEDLVRHGTLRLEMHHGERFYVAA